MLQPFASFSRFLQHSSWRQLTNHYQSHRPLTLPSVSSSGSVLSLGFPFVVFILLCNHHPDQIRVLTAR